MADQPYQSLYRQYRPQRFGEVRGQDHVSLALRNAVRTARVGHAYLFSGPRGTGKTSTARILAKALNCANLDDGEPCGVCDSCVAITTGSSLDVLELDAASNNGVDAMRDLVARAALGSPGRWKVYIVDEVHMLSTAASNALLKTLEEPPGHVVFVLATTDPQKVLPTIRSRTQPFEFHLMSTDVLSDLIRDISKAAGLDLDDTSVARVVRRGNGSARDALSVLDQVAAAGEALDEPDIASAVIDAIAEHDVAAVLAAVAKACGLGRDPRRIAVEVVERMRNAFLAVMAPEVLGATIESAVLETQARSLGTPALVRAMEVLGEALVVMRDALDTRVTLEVALVRVTAPEADSSVESLVERVDRLERRMSAASSPATTPASTSAATEASTEATGSSATLGAIRRAQPPERPGKQAPSAATKSKSPDPPVGVGGDVPDRDEITKAWGDSLLAQLGPPARAGFRGGRWVAVEDGTAVFAVPNAFHCERAEARRRDVEEVLSAHFGVRIRVRVIEEPGAAPLTTAVEAEHVLTTAEVADLEVADVAAPGVAAEERVMRAFPGAEEVP